MQLYGGLPIITNKITTEEQQGIPHHLLGCIGLDEQTWVVGTFVERALKTIDEICSRGKLPILVGGTHYYTQSLLFKDRLAETASDVRKIEFEASIVERWPILEQPTDVLLEELAKVDPVMANRWHPNDRRKIQRSLAVYLQTGKQASTVYAEQRGRDTSDKNSNAEANSAGIAASLRFPTLLFWINADTDALRQRLDNRVDKMLAKGLLEEVKTLQAFADAEAVRGRAVDETRGIWVSIGYKEFKAYAQALASTGTTEQRLQILKAEALERTKIATRQYAKRQVRWIRIKMINALAEAGMGQNMYVLDGSDVSAFDRNVVEPAVELCEKFLSGSPLPDPSQVYEGASNLLIPSRDYDLSAAPEKWTKQHCTLCGVTCVTEEQWTSHVKSKAHRKLTSKSRDAHTHRSETAGRDGSGG